jgi:hypothetical protein
MLLQVVNKWIKEYKNSLYKEEGKEEGKEERQEEEEGGLVSPALEQEQDQDLAAYDRYIFFFFWRASVHVLDTPLLMSPILYFFTMSGIFMHLHLSVNLEFKDLKII